MNYDNSQLPSKASGLADGMQMLRVQCLPSNATWASSLMLSGSTTLAWLVGTML
jgi:hypothetical protein